MHAALLLVFVAFGLCAHAQNISIPGATSAQDKCVAGCIFDNFGQASNCNQNTDDNSCFCQSVQYVGVVEQCAAAQCGVCTKSAAGCNVTANVLEAQCGSNVVSVSGSVTPKTIAAAPTPSSSGSFGSPGNSAPGLSPRLTGAAAVGAALFLVGLAA